MAGIYYADYFLPKLYKIEDFISTLPKNWIEEYKSFNDFFKDVRDRFDWDKVAIGNNKLNLDALTSLISNFFTKTKINPGSINYLIYTDKSTANLNQMVNIPYYIQKKFELKNACVFTLDHQCGASCLAIGLAMSLISQKSEYIFIISNNLVPNENRLGPGMILGDGVSLFVIDKKSVDYKIIDFQSISNGYGSYLNFNKDKINNYEDDTKEFFATMHLRGIKFIKSILSRNKLNINDVYMLIV